MILLNFLSSFPNDSGPIYKETLAGRLPVEPFNTFSNLFFLAIIIYFSIKVYKNYRQHLFLAFAIPVLFISFFGGTIYHATRSHEIWLLLDWVPIILLCLSVSVYFSFKVGTNWYKKTAILVLVFLLIFGVRIIDWPEKLSISIGYLGTVFGLLLPVILYLIKTSFKNGLQIILAVFSFALAISFRVLDSQFVQLEMGTHWLWHSFGAIAVFFLMNFIFKDKKEAFG